MRLHLRTLLAILILATTIPMAAFAAWLISRSSGQQQALIDRQNVDQARAILVAVDQEVEATVATLGVLSLLDPVDAPDKRHFSEIAARVLPLHPGWESVRLIDRSLKIVSTTAVDGEPSVLRNPQWVKEVLATGRPAVSTVVQQPRGEWTVSIGVPVRRGGAIKYVLGVRLKAGMFGDVLRRQNTPVDGVVTLLDGAQRIIARTRNEDKYVGQPPMPDFAERTRQHAEGSGRTRLLEGVEAYSAWSRSALTGWSVGIGMPSEPIDAPIRHSFIALMAAGFGLSAAGLMLALLLGRQLVRVQSSAAAAARSLARGDTVIAFKSRIAEADELGQALREAAAILGDRLRERDEAQAEADRTRAALLERETSARHAAEALNRAKDEFVATVSHELRTPLNAIFGWVAMLRTGSLEASQQTHAFDVIDRNTRAQAQLIEDLLDMSRAIQGSVRLVMEPLDLSIVLDAAVESLRPTADARKTSIDVRAERGVALVTGDYGRLQQTIWNLLSNAIKFTPPGGRIDARLTAGHGNAVLRISDSGEGIAPEFLPYVFDRFRQEDGDVTRTHSGLGLGLSLARHLVELHGGTIAVDSAGKGQGATFTVTLPLLAKG